MSESTSGLCACGCGEPTRTRYVKGHNNRKPYTGATSWANKAEFLAAHLDERLAKRFWTKVSKDGPVPAHRPELGPCWIWTRAKDLRGYGNFSVGPASVRQHFNAHRIAAALDGRIPGDDQMVCHHCDNPSCVRPTHLFVGSHSENMRDMLAKGRGKKPRDTCHLGHSLADEANVYVYTYGSHTQRVCITCHRERGREYHLAQKQKGAA